MNPGKKIDLSKINHKALTIYEALGIKEEEFNKLIEEGLKNKTYIKTIKSYENFEFSLRPKHSPHLMSVIYNDSTEREELIRRGVLTYEACKFLAEKGISSISIEDFMDIVLSIRQVNDKPRFEKVFNSPKNSRYIDK